MSHKIFLLVQFFIAVSYAEHQKYPGTNTRPVLSDAEASHYTKQAYLQGWSPSTIHTSFADFIVGKGHYGTIQAAVNAAIKAGGTKRKYIQIQPGTYAQAVLIPKTTVPITIYGTPGNPAAVHIVLSQGANLSGAKYANQVNPNGANYKQGDPAWSMYNGCATRATIGTSCSSVVWAANDNFEITYMTIENPSLDGQAVAARSDADKQHWNSVNLYGFQDTLLAGGKRVYFNKAIIKGDVDFIFGSASAVFESTQIIARSDRPRNTAVIFAPNTDNSQKYGYLLINSKITAESKTKSNKGVRLARAWDSSSNPSANGQIVIRDTQIDDVLDVYAPYDTATSGRKFSGNANTNRNMDDPKYNRFWEYKNTGGGA